MAGKETDKTSKEPFVSEADRPDVNLNPDTPISELTVRDLASLLAHIGGTRKDFWDGKSWQKDDFDGLMQPKYSKEHKTEKWEIKEGKDHKTEKSETKEHLRKELKLEKLETDGTFEPTLPIGPDPRFDQVVQAISGLTSRVAELADQVEELKKAQKG
jgi:hypothetical protein